MTLPDAFNPVLVDGELTLRPLRLRDARELDRALLGNREWLQPWEASSPRGPGRWDVRAGIRAMLDLAKSTQALPLVLEHEGRIIGQLTVSGIVFGALGSASIGYWIAADMAGRGLTTRAVAMVTDHCLERLGLHRMEICIRPENASSLRIVEKLGFRYEGLRRRYIHIDGDWRDHVCFAVVKEEVPNGVYRRFLDGAADPELARVPDDDLRRAASEFKPGQA